MAIMKDNRLDNISLGVTNMSPVSSAQPLKEPPPTETTVKPEPKKEERRFVTTAEFPEELRVPLKMLCIKYNINQRKVIADAVRYYIQEVEKGSVSPV